MHGWLRRYEDEGLDGLADRSHRPASCPHQMTAVVEAVVLELRRAHGYWGARRIAVEIARHERLSAGTGAAILGDASHHLVRALISSAGDDARRARDVVEQSLLSQVRVHVHQHLRDPSLDSTSVAAALSVSRRHLQRVCAAAGFSLEQHVIGRRLEGAKQELATASGRRRPIAAVALSWGFKDPTHFARRFRAAYGLTPSEWRAEASDDHG